MNCRPTQVCAKWLWAICLLIGAGQTPATANDAASGLPRKVYEPPLELRKVADVTDEDEVEIAGRKAQKVILTGSQGSLAEITVPDAAPGRYRAIYELGLPTDQKESCSFAILIHAKGVETREDDLVGKRVREHFPLNGRPLAITREFVLGEQRPITCYLEWTGPKTMTVLVYGARVERMDDGVALAEFRSRKVLYTPGEQGAIEAVLFNTLDREVTATLLIALTRDFTALPALPSITVRLKPGERKEVATPFTAGPAEYGYQVTGVLKEGEAALDSRADDVFNVADNVWKVALGSPGLWPMSWHSYDATPKSNRENIALLRRLYCNWHEKGFWAPCDWGDLTPETPQWVSGQAGRAESGAMIKDFNQVAHENGIRSITYGKQTGSSTAGWETARRRPDWFDQDRLGKLSGNWDAEDFLHWDDFRRFDDSKWKDSGVFNFKTVWYYNYPQFVRLDVLDHGIDELIQSTKQFGWDGVRFDGHWSAGNDEMSVRNYQRMKERIWAVFPDYVFGYNDDNPSSGTARAYGHDHRERMAGYGHHMNERIRNWSYGDQTGSPQLFTSWRAYAEAMLADVEIIRKLGGTYHCILDSHRNYYKFMLATAAGAHNDYGDQTEAPGCPNWGRFLTRWSGMVYDVMLQTVPVKDRVEVKAAAPLWWDKWVTERVRDGKTLQRIVHLLNPPAEDTIYKGDEPARNERSQPVTDVIVRTKVGKIGALVGAYLLDPDNGDEPQRLAVKREGEWAQVVVPDVTGWSLVVWEFSGQFTRPKAPPRMTERPDPAKVAEIKYSPPTPSDPLQQQTVLTATEAKSVSAIARTWAHVAGPTVVKDPDSHAGVARRVDGSCPNSGDFYGMNVYGFMPAGRYRATYRMKIEDKSKPSGCAIFASEGSRGSPWYEIGAGSFKESNVYQDFSYEFDYFATGMLNVGGFWRGQGLPGAILFDTVTLEFIESLTDAVIEERSGANPLSDELVPGAITADFSVDEWKKMAGILSEAPKSPEEPGEKMAIDPATLQALVEAEAFANAPVRALVVSGLYGDLYHLDQALAANWHVTNAYAGSGDLFSGPYLRGFPEKVEQLFRYHLVVLANVDGLALGFERRRQLKHFVQQGGGLLILGGMQALGQGSYKGSFLDDLLPVQVAVARDVQLAEKPMQFKPAETGLAHKLPAEVWKAPTYLYWRHIVRPKPEAQVHLYAGQEPVLFTGTFGKGRVALFTGTVLGEPAGKEQPFWQWSGWPLLMNKTIGWLAQGPAAE